MDGRIMPDYARLIFYHATFYARSKRVYKLLSIGYTCDNEWGLKVFLTSEMYLNQASYQNNYFFPSKYYLCHGNSKNCEACFI